MIISHNSTIKQRNNNLNQNSNARTNKTWCKMFVIVILFQNKKKGAMNIKQILNMIMLHNIPNEN